MYGIFNYSHKIADKNMTKRRDGRSKGGLNRMPFKMFHIQREIFFKYLFTGYFHCPDRFAL